MQACGLTAARTTLRIGRAAEHLSPRWADHAADCATHSYGQVRQFLTEHPCDAVYRAVFEVPAGPGASVLVAVAWVDMPDPAQATALRQLMDRSGTGNITELSRERNPYRAVRFDGRFYESNQDDTTVVNAQAQPVGATAVAAAELAEEAVTAAVSS